MMVGDLAMSAAGGLLRKGKHNFHRYGACCNDGCSLCRLAVRGERF